MEQDNKTKPEKKGLPAVAIEALAWACIGGAWLFLLHVVPALALRWREAGGDLSSLQQQLISASDFVRTEVRSEVLFAFFALYVIMRFARK